MIWAFLSTLVGLLPIVLKYVFREKKKTDEALAISARESAASRKFQEDLQNNRDANVSRSLNDLITDTESLLELPEKPPE